MNDSAKYRLPLPDDPIAQLAVGVVGAPSLVTIPSSGVLSIAPANPMRVALYVQPVAVNIAWLALPFLTSITPVATGSGTPQFLSWTTFDYPGLPMLEWYIYATASDTFLIWDYQLAPWE